MKPFGLTILAAIVAGLATGNPTSTQSGTLGGTEQAALQRLEASTQKALLGGEEAPSVSGQADVKLAAAVQQAADAEAYTHLLYELSAGPGGVSHPVQSSNAETLLEKSAGRVLVVPDDQTTPKDLVPITEDLCVMARIFDKKLGVKQSPYLAALSPPRGRTSFLSDDSQLTKALYVAGYGAVFFLRADCPLSAPPQAPPEASDSAADSVWEQAKLEISSPTALADPFAAYQTYVNRGAVVAAVRAYDADKVEDLKRELVRTLKHAANIRCLKPQEKVVLVITGTQQPVVVKTTGSKTDKAVVVTRSLVLKQYLAGSWTTVLTITATRNDVDAFSRGALDFEQFRSKATFLTSQARIGTLQAVPSELPGP